MAASVGSGLLDKAIAPRPLFLGMVLAFLGCCLLGRLAGSVNLYEKFQRFHFRINTQTQFFPTASQVRELGKAILEPDRVAVIVGGNSILYGHGQREQAVWSDRLQELLGDRFRVINLGTPGALPWEFGGLGGEILARDRPRIVFLSCIEGWGRTDARPDGYNYRHFFWDAYYKGLVPLDAGREQRLSAVVEKEKSNPAFQEMRLRLAFDAAAYANDLWTTVAYRWVNTVWVPRLKDKIFLQPRCTYAPPVLPPLSPDDRCPQVDKARRLGLLSGLANTCDATGIVESCRIAFPGAMRERTCMVVARACPRYTTQLEPSVRNRYEAFFPAAVRALREGGFSALDLGADFTDLDYYDWCHLSEEGGAKLATEVAVEVRALAERLGYLEREGQP
jgi:hypothetical protein